MKENPYPKFFLMLGVSFVVMYTVMFLNVDSTDHIYLSLNRTYMTLLMVSPMALLMLGFMGHMYKNKATNAIIITVSVSVPVSYTHLDVYKRQGYGRWWPPRSPCAHDR